MSRWPNKLQARVRTALKPAAVFVGGASVAEAAAQFEAWAAQHAGSVCEIGLAGAWVHVCVVPTEVVDASAGDEAAWLDYARLQLDHYFGLSAAAWSLAASHDARAPLVCALSTELLDALRAAAAAHQVRVQRVAPWWVRGVQAVLQDALNDENVPRAVAAIEPDRATLVVAQGGRITRVIGEASLAALDWRARLSGGPAASLWSFKLGAGDAQALALRGQVAPELVFQQIEVAP